jgi:thioredoxin 1
MDSLNERAFEEIVENGGEPCLVLFSRKTCNVCQEVHTVLEELIQDYKDSGFGFYQIDAEEEESLLKRYKLQGVPQVLFFDGGIMKKRLSGRHNDDAYISEIEKYIE